VTARSPSFYAWVSLATSIVTIILKFAAYYLTGSVGLLSDAIEAFVNIVAALVALGVLTYAEAGPDREHNFGHEKAQYFSSGIEGALIFVAAGGIMWTAIPRLMHPQEIDQVSLGLGLSVLAALANVWCAWIMLRAASFHRSITLEADARHLLTDVWTTAGVFAGVLLVQWTGWLRLDPLIAIAVAVQILWLDELRGQGGDYHALRTRISGAKSFVDVHVLLPGKMSIQAGHDLVERLENDIRARLPHVEVLTHLEPLEDPKSWDDPKRPLAGN
jgi:divalent metal cation (Fe/Co/Zn/Cd) transporter